MVDSSWDNGGLPPEDGGKLSTGAKVALGCGLALVLAIGSCVVLVGGAAWWGKTRGVQILDSQWDELRRVEEALRTDEGAQRLYAASPGLASAYPTREDFLKAVAERRPRLAAIPEHHPGLKLFHGGPDNLHLEIRTGQSRLVRMRYRMDSGAFLSAEWRDGRLTALQVE